MKILTLLFSLVFWFTLLIPGFQVEKPDIISVEDWGESRLQEKWRNMRSGSLPFITRE